MEYPQQVDDAKDTLFMMGGVALVIFGAGLILSNPIVRRFMGQAGMGSLSFLGAAVPDVEKYLRLRNM
jgi:hypothetical protein